MSATIPNIPGLASARRYQIPAESLQCGMFVTELDRPWLDTPFLLQGFLVDSQIELDTLRRYCRYVYVDLDLSGAHVAEAIRKAELGSTPFEHADAPADDAPLPLETAAPEERRTRHAAPSRPVRIRSDVKISSQTRERFRRFIKATAVASEASQTRPSLFGRTFDWLRSMTGHANARDEMRALQADSHSAIRSQLPPEMKLRRYADRAPVEEELPRAREAFGRGSQVLDALMADVRSGRVPSVQEVGRAVDDMVDSMIDNPDALMWVARLREEDHGTYQHGVKVGLYLVALGRHLGFPRRDLAHLGMIGMLADVGKTRLPRALLDKPGMLTPSEHNVVKEHVRLGLEALTQSVALAEPVMQGIAQHHERLDGSGYPKGLKGEEIGIYGRMAAIADSFAALVTARPYANASAPQDALMNLYEWAGTSFHEPLVEQFVQSIGIFPVGSLVELSTGEVAVVLAHNRVRRLEPRVLVLTTPEKTPLGTPFERDLLTRPKDREHRPIRIVRGLAAGAYGLKLRDYYAGQLAAEAEPLA